MATSSKRLRRSRLALVFCSLASVQAQAQESPAFRKSLLRAPPPIVALALAPRAVTPAPGFDPALFEPVEAPAIARIAPAPSEPVDERDFAFDLLTPDQRALAVALADWRQGRGADHRRLRAAIVDAYAARDFTPFWRDGADWSAAARAVASRLSAAGEDGLDLRNYRIPVTETAGRLEDDLALSEAVAAYVLQAAGGRIDPERISRLIGSRPALPDPRAALARVAALGRAAGDALRDYNPPHDGYRQLRAKLAELRARQAPRDADRLAFGETSNDSAADSPDGEMRSSRRKKAEPASPARLESEILANMERWRWLPRDLGETHVEVNIPEFTLAVVRSGAVTHRARVIVGKTDTPTPIFSNAMRYIIVNPSWNVPQSIIQKELLPKHGGDLSGLSARGWKVTYARGQIAVRQPPGEDNALGRVKFVFPNDFAVYMHDTPSRALFAASRRAFSHGCMRVEDPFALAAAVLGPGSGWSEERVKRLIGASERYINLAAPLPVHIEYFTAFVDESGRLALREDLYGYSARVRQELGLGG